MFYKNQAEVPIDNEIQVEIPEFKTPNIKNSAQMYSLAVILFVYIASYFQHKGFVSGVLITEFVIILLPPFIFLAFNGMNPRYVLRLNKVSISNIFTSIGILLFSLPLVFIVNGIYIFFLKRVFGSISTPNIPIAKDIPELFLFFFIIGVSAGICEEVLFRGLIMRGLEKFGPIKSIFITGILFAMLHISLEKIPATFLLGVIIGFVVYRTNSIFTGMLMHFANNSLSTFLSYLFTIAGGNSINNSYSTQPDLSSLMGGSTEIIIAFVFIGIFLIFFAIICMAVLYFLVKRLLNNTQNVTIKEPIEKASFKNKDLLWFIPGVTILLLLTFGEGLSLLNIDSESYKTLLRIMQISK